MATTILQGGNNAYDAHQEKTRLAQKQADKWLMAGTVLMGATILGLIGLPMFLYGLYLQLKAQKEGLSVRPMMVTLVGYLVAIDAAINSFGWSMDMIANHTLVARVFMTSWGNMFDAGYFWHYNELWVGGATAPGEKSWEAACLPLVFCMRMAAAIGFLQMKRWGHQWLVITCWFGVVIWFGYVANMTVFADVRYHGVVFPVWGWWLFDIFYISPYLAIPYLHSVNREIFSD